MPRIEPVQLLSCLRVLLDENGGILSTNEVKRLEGLMTKYSKKLVSKCIYVLILKSTKTELLDEFMAAGGWSLVYIWLNDAIRGMNWPLVQEVVELLLLSPVHVDRLKINSAPRLVKGLSKEGGTEGVRLLAKHLVDQWLKIVTSNAEVEDVIRLQQQQQQQQLQQQQLNINKKIEMAPNTITTEGINNNNNSNNVTDMGGNGEHDPLEGVGQHGNTTGTYALTTAQKKANESGLVYKIILKNGQQVLAKVTPSKPSVEETNKETKTLMRNYNENDRSEEYIIQEDVEVDEDNSALDIIEEDVDYVDQAADKSLTKDNAQSKQDVIVVKMKSANKESEKRKSTDSIKKDKDKSKDKSKSHRSSTSSNHKSQSSTATEKKSSSSSSKTSKSSSSSHRSSSSSDKHRSSTSSSSKKDKDKKDSSRHSSGASKNSSSSSASHKSSSLKKSSDSITTTTTTQKLDKEKEVLATPTPLSKEKSATKQALEKLGRIPKKVRTASESETPTSIVIPSKKASISIEIRRDNEKASTVKTYKSQFRSHGLNEAAPPPPSRKGLKKPVVTPNTLPMPIPSLKRASPTRESTEIKKPKIDINNITVPQTKPGAIKLIPPKKIQTLVETNIFSDALSAATGPKKNVKRKRSTTPGPSSKDGQNSPTSPDSPKVTPLKFYQDTLDEKSNKDSDNSATENEENDKNKKNSSLDNKLNDSIDKDEDDDLPLKKVKEDLEKQIQGEESALEASINEQMNAEEEELQANEPKKPGPGCGPNGPPGVLMLSRRRGPKKKLKWRPLEELEQVRYFELDETERVNVTKSSFVDMKNRERCNERESINSARRDTNLRDNMEEQTAWRTLIEVEDVPDHPNGSQSKQRVIQAEREQTTLRALYFTKALIPDSPAEAELEPHYPHDIPIIPLDDITGNPDAVNNYTNMPWPEPKGSPKHGDNMNAGTGGLMSSGDLFANILGGNDNPFTAMGSPFNNNTNVTTNSIPPVQMNSIPLNANIVGNMNNNNNNNNNWNMPIPPFGPNGPPMMNNNQYNTRMPNGPNLNGPGGPNFMGGQFGAGVGPGPGPMNGNNMPFGNGPQFGPNNFNGPNFRGPNGPPMNGPLGPLGPMLNNGPPMGMNRNNGGNNRNNWTSNGNGPWRSAGSGPNRGNNNNNNGICKAFMRGHCRVGKSCKYIHPMKNKRI